MSGYNQSRYYRDLDGWTLARGSITFDGTAGKGAQGTVTLFDVTGVVEISSLSGTVETSTDGATATIAIGVSGDAPFLAATLATAMDAGQGVGGDAGFGYASNLALLGTRYVTTIFADIEATIAEANVTAGVMHFYLWWRPLSADGNVALGSAMEQI